MKYIVGFSGGIDSTFVAWLLKKQGHQVLLVNLKNTNEPNKCCKLPTDLIKIAQKLNLPLKIVDVTKEFKKFVIDYFANSYKLGLTPNPCINCNWLVRFPILNRIRKELGYDKIATGHYAKVIKKDNNYYLARAKDLKKDQTYMLYRIVGLQDENGESLLKYIEFPLGSFTKEDIKKISKETNLPLANTKESQNVCFIPDDDYPRFLKQNYNIISKPGPIYDKNGNYLGEHRGIIYYTIGQRKNIFLKQEKIAMNKKWYVIKIDPQNNALILGEEKDLYKKEIIITSSVRHHNFKSYFMKSSYTNLPTSSLYGKIRYHHQGEKIKRIEKFEENKYKIIFEKPVRAPTPGQHLVIYQGNQKENDIVMGGGIII